MKHLKIGTGLGLLAVAGVASACWYSNFSSVHFHTGEPDFGTLPRRGVLHWSERDTRPLPGTSDNGYPAINGWASYIELEDSDNTYSQEMRRYNQTGLVKRACATANNGRWEAARLKLHAIARHHGQTGNLNDMVMVLSRGITLPAAQRKAIQPAMQHYLQAMQECEKGQPFLGDKVFEQLLALPSIGFLREHALYQRASFLAQISRSMQARRQFRQLLIQYPHSPKREETLIMLIRTAILPHHQDLRDMTEGKRAMAQLQKEFPHSRFLKELPGLRARLLFLDKQYHAALNAYFRLADPDSAKVVIAEMPRSQQDAARVRLLAAYLRQLAAAKQYKPYQTAIVEADLLRQRATVAQARQFAAMLRSDPQLASDYLYYRLYHTDNKPADYQQLARFAEEVARRNARMRFTPEVLTRFAEAAYRERAYSRALAWANRSLAQQITARALYVRGASQHKLKHIISATQDFETIVTRFPQSPLLPNVRENLALLYEAVGRYDKALTQFLALSWGTNFENGYDEDVAYLLDCRMTTAQVANYVRSNPRHKDRDLLRYSLGIRYLRDERWNEAEQEFRRIPRKLYTEFSRGRKEWSEIPSPEPLSVVRDLRLRQRKIAQAKTNNARAKAMYEYASYYSTNGTLLLYNAALWDDEREKSFDYDWNKTVVTKEDEKAVRRYMYEHEAFARSRSLCKEIARQYPNAPIIPNVLYREAAATRRLCSFNKWWNGEDERAKLWNESIRTMRRIARTYPKHSVAVHARKYAVVFENERKELVWERMNRKPWRTAAESRYAAVTKTK